MTIETEPVVTPMMRVQRRLTQAFIDRVPVTLSFTRREKIELDTGGFRWMETPGATQTVSLVEPGDSNQRRPERGLDGVEQTLSYLLVAPWYAQLEADMTFEYEGDKFIIVQMMPWNGHEVRAAVERHGVG